ncbi:MAG TPA: HD domain-containing phosphohydrolase, partial [Candidatus Eisenbacteria bacterium]|nr:HD domain-containing phosphohydrolase [Candidatus Eisenbacteria bacterium]
APVPLPRGNGTASLTTSLDLAAILLFGPAGACWVALGSRLVMILAERRQSPLAGLLRAGTSIFAVGAGGIVYLALGGRTGAELAPSLAQLVPALGAALAYVSVKTGIGAASAALGAPRLAGQAGLAYVQESALPDLALFPVGYVLALTQVRVGPTGLALFLLPLLLARYFFLHWIETKRAHIDMVRTLMTAVDAADPLTWGHSYRISKMCVRVGRHLGMTERDLEELEFAALLHDIGRTAIRRDILVKPGRLTEHEQSLLRTHPKVGYEILSGMRLYRNAPEIVYAHHEQPDGKGYPRGLQGEEIPLGSRIIMTVGAFDAMTSDRPYRRGLSTEAAIEELKSHSGTQFFPDVVDALVALSTQGTLFDELEPEQLVAYAQGLGSSRAIDEWLKTKKPSLGESAGRGLPETPAVDEDAEESGAGRGLPVIEFPLSEVSRRADGRIIALNARGDWKLTTAGLSDLGCRRTNNEDSFGIYDFADDTRGCLLVLADGMGGAAGGEVASRLAVEEVHAAYLEERGATPRETLGRGFEAANRTIRERARAEKDLDGMGTTCTAVSVVGRDLVVAHVGDSRAYLVDTQAIQQLSVDHTVASELAKMGAGRGAAAKAASHVLTRSLGSQDIVPVDLSSSAIRLEDAAAVVLCSDGLSGMVGAEEIHDIVREESPESACHTLVELARARGGPDNITVVIAKLERASA